MTTAVACVASLALLILGLGFAVSMTRAKKEQISGMNQDPEDLLYKLIRSHGNATEYVPILAIMMLYLGSQQPGPLMQALFIIVTAGRFIQAYGMVSCRSLGAISPFRMAGSLSTYIGGLILAIAMLLSLGGAG